MPDPETIYNWRRFGDRVTTSGQPTEQLLADIRALGVIYMHIPVDFQNSTAEDFSQLCSVMERLKHVPVHVHCIANYRVSAFFYRYRRDVLGVDEAEARAEMEEIWHPTGVWAAFVSLECGSGR